jgi:hypothetical protein
MPHIVNRRLEILYDLARQQAGCIVTCTLIFTKQECQQQVNKNLQYEMKCQLFGASSGWNGRDKLLHSYEVKYIANGAMIQPVHLTFDGVIPISQLTKDASKDEIYGLLTLTNPTLEPRKLKKQTNPVEIIQKHGIQNSEFFSGSQKFDLTFSDI